MLAFVNGSLEMGCTGGEACPGGSTRFCALVGDWIRFTRLTRRVHGCRAGFSTGSCVPTGIDQAVVVYIAAAAQALAVNNRLALVRAGLGIGEARASQRAQLFVTDPQAFVRGFLRFRADVTVWIGSTRFPRRLNCLGTPAEARLHLGAGISQAANEVPATCAEAFPILQQQLGVGPLALRNCRHAEAGKQQSTEHKPSVHHSAS